ncbi:MAG: 50S ribosomal protein L13 [Methanobacteriota archaeon]|jgi:large subunit ribosomal protein L13|uniref:Large ribosomal subunit protein uL13 n=1 Tax=Marine Group III euryarchaeote TaxID=2173149 RepID=A0A7J4GQN6_9ARCH|nr:MAG: 50S ribosomal protein L13 [Euryarchaeota archaeon]HIF36947.1 50S ribosomal protein L13 [Marine Group III euryarchaeote]
MKIIDASECIMGRLASSVAKSLLNGEEVHIINAENAVISGSKDMVFGEYISKRNLNHPRKGPYYPRMPHLMLKRAVRGMIPYQKPKGREAFKRLKVDVGTPLSLQKEKAETIENAKMNDSTKYIRLGDVSKNLGAKFNG